MQYRYRTILTYDLARLWQLGAGTGVGGLTAAAFGANVLLSDKAELLPLLGVNIEANGLSNNARAVELLWGFEAHYERVLGESEGTPPFDLIIGSDLLYAP